MHCGIQSNLDTFQYDVRRYCITLNGLWTHSGMIFTCLPRTTRMVEQWLLHEFVGHRVFKDTVFEHLALVLTLIDTFKWCISHCLTIHLDSWFSCEFLVPVLPLGIVLISLGWLEKVSWLIRLAFVATVRLSLRNSFKKLRCLSEDLWWVWNSPEHEEKSEVYNEP